MEQYHFTTGEVDVYFPKHEEDKDKYLVLTCAKNEDKYLLEFVEHYLNLDFDKIIIADNNDEPTIIPILQKYIDSGQVEVWNCRGFNSFQVQLYSMFANEGNYKWCGYFDADEFLEIGVYRSIKKYLEHIEENCVSFNWIIYGSNGEKHYKDKPLKERFPTPVTPITHLKENAFIKSILRGGDCWNGCWFNGSHIPTLKSQEESKELVYNVGGYHKSDSNVHCYYPFRYKEGYIRHYYTKSFDEWMMKANRGWPDGTPNLKSSTFFAFDKKGTFDFDQVIYAAFGSGSDYYDDILKDPFFNNVFRDYSVIEFRNADKLVYALVVSVLSLMKNTTDHTFLFTDEHVDDSLFTIFLECALCTGNRAVYCKSQEEVWEAFQKYRKNEGTYYIITLN